MSKVCFCVEPEFFKGFHTDEKPQKLEMDIATIKTVVENGLGPVYMKSCVVKHPYVKGNQTDNSPKEFDGKLYVPAVRVASTSFLSIDSVLFEDNSFWKIHTDSGTTYFVLE